MLTFCKRFSELWWKWIIWSAEQRAHIAYIGEMTVLCVHHTRFHIWHQRFHSDVRVRDTDTHIQFSYYTYYILNAIIPVRRIVVLDVAFRLCQSHACAAAVLAIQLRLHKRTHRSHSRRAASKVIHYNVRCVCVYVQTGPRGTDHRTRRAFACLARARSQHTIAHAYAYIYLFCVSISTQLYIHVYNITLHRYMYLCSVCSVTECVCVSAIRGCFVFSLSSIWCVAIHLCFTCNFEKTCKRCWTTRTVDRKRLIFERYSFIYARLSRNIYTARLFFVQFLLAQRIRTANKLGAIACNTCVIIKTK